MAFDANVPLAANQIAADLVAMNANWEFVVHGDGTAGRVMRRIMLTIADGTNADTIKVTGASRWNGDTLAEENNLGKSGDTGNFNLDATGYIVTIEAGGLSGNCVAVLSAKVYDNACQTDLLVKGTADTNNITLYFKDTATGANVDLTVLVQTGNLILHILYLTDA